MIGRLALPDGENTRPAVLIAHEGPGLDEHQKDRASRFAEMGYGAFALDYHGGGKPLAPSCIRSSTPVLACTGTPPICSSFS